MIKLSTIAWALGLAADYLHHEIDAAHEAGAKDQIRRAKMRKAEKRARKLAMKVLAAFRDGVLDTAFGSEGAGLVYNHVRYGDLVEVGATREEEETIHAWADLHYHDQAPEKNDALVVEPIPAEPAVDERLRAYAQQMASGSPIVRSSLTAHNASWLKDQDPKVVRDALAHAFGQSAWSLASYHVHGLLLGVTGLDIDPKPPTTQHRGFDVSRAFQPMPVAPKADDEYQARLREAEALARKVAKAWATTPAATRTDVLGALTPDALTWLQACGVPAAFEGVEPDFDAWPRVTPEGRTVDRHQLASSFSLACNVLLGVGMPQIKPPIDAYPPPWKGVMDAVGDTSDPYSKLPVLPTLVPPAQPAPAPEPHAPETEDPSAFI